MAIIIPSKNIYGVKNPKIRNNIIDKVNIKYTDIYPSNDYEKPVFNSEQFVDAHAVIKEENIDKKDFLSAVTEGSVAYYSCSYLNNHVGYITGTLEIPKVSENSYIKKLYNGDNDFFAWGFSGKKITKDCSATVLSKAHENFNDSAEMSKIQYSNEVQKETSLSFPDLPVSVKATIKYPLTLGLANLTSEVIGISSESYFKATEKTDSFEIEYKLLSYLLVEKLSGTAINPSLTKDKEIILEGTYEEFIGEEVSFTVYGNTIGISLKDGSVSIGDGTKPFSLEESEFLQHKRAAEKLGENILAQYKNGKETAEIICGINEYYGEDGKVYISTTPNKDYKIDVGMVFEPATGGGYSRFLFSIDKPFEYDIYVGASYDEKNFFGIIKKGTLYVGVDGDSTMNDSSRVTQLPSYYHPSMVFLEGQTAIPMTFGADGNDYPMSSNMGGNPKQFRICGTEITYDGSLLQKLYLQEI